MHSPSASSPESYEGHDLEALADLPHYVGWIAQGLGAHLHGRVLEVGAGTGNFTSSYIDAVDEAVLLEPARNLFPRLAARFANRAHVRTVCGVLEEWSDSGSPFDAAVMINVLEHIADDLGTVRRLGSMLRPGGKLLIFVPALRWLYGSLDTSVHHFRRYSRSSLGRLMQRAGLETLSLRYFDAAGVVPWFVAGRVLRQRAFSATAARIYDRAVVPVTSRLERLLRLPMGKNLICVAQRPHQVAAAALRAA
jgi:SAM-dependent methyltransferase